VSKRWSSHVSRDIRPLGLKQLGIDAVEILWLTAPPELIETLEGDQVKPTKELALRYVDGLAMKFRQDGFLMKGAPRVGVDRKEMLHIQGLVTELRDALEDTNDFTRIGLQMGCFKFDDGLPASPLVARANVAGLPLPGEIGARGAPSGWALQLDALAHYLDRCIGKCSQKEDRGGNTNAYKEDWGSPESALVESAWYVFDLFKPGKASGSETGPFQEFVDTIANYATGHERTSLHAAVKRWSKQHRESKHEVTELTRLRRERKLSHTSVERLDEIQREEDVILGLDGRVRPSEF
jgi:hypothetical protein